MKLTIRVKKINDKLAIILPNLVAEKAELKEGDALDVSVKRQSLSITNQEADKAITIDNGEDIFRKILKEEQLILAK